jgi:hypothetical protein
VRSKRPSRLRAIERGLAQHIAQTPGLPERFSSFYKYLSQANLWELAGATTVRVHGLNQSRPSESLKSSERGKVYFARDGHDQSIVQAFSDQGKTVVLLSTDGQRQRVEMNYLQSFCNAAVLSDRVTCLRTITRLPISQEAFKYQLLDRLRVQYLVGNLHVKAGELTHGAMLMGDVFALGRRRKGPLRRFSASADKAARRTKRLVLIRCGVRHLHPRLRLPPSGVLLS